MGDFLGEKKKAKYWAEEVFRDASSAAKSACTAGHSPILNNKKNGVLKKSLWGGGGGGGLGGGLLGGGWVREGTKQEPAKSR